MLGLFSFFFLFIFPTGVLKCKRASAYSRWRWCRGGKGLQRVREFHSHHPSFPLGKAWICARVCGKKKKKSFLRESECVKFSLLGIRDSHILTHIPSFQRPDLFLPPGFCSGYTSSSAEKKGGSCRRRMCLFIESGSAWKVSNRQQPPQTQRKGSPLSPGWSGQRWTQGLEFGYGDEQAEETNKVPQREEYFFPPRLNSIGMHLVLGYPSVQNLSPLLGGCTTPSPWENPSWLGFKTGKVVIVNWPTWGEKLSNHHTSLQTL